MADPTPVPTGRRGLSTAARLALSGGVVAVGMALVAATSLALFTDNDTVESNSFGTGDVDITATPTATAITMSNMAPGDTVYDDVVVTNDGSLEMRYSVESWTTEDYLAAKLVFTVKPGTTCDQTLFDDTNVAELYSGILGDQNGHLVLGDQTAGADTGDRVLAAGASEKLCLKVHLPDNADNTYVNLTTVADLKFFAEQTTNNA